MPVESADHEWRSWLDSAVRENQPLKWTGHGASFALARAFAAALGERGGNSQAVSLSQCQGAGVCLVSQSARDPGIAVALLVAEHGRSEGWAATPRLEVPGGGLVEWLPLSFLRRAIEVFSAGLGVPAWPRVSGPVLEPREEILVVGRSVGPVRALAESARHKLEELPLEVTSCEELGHGLHARLWRRPEAHRVRLLDGGEEERKAMMAVRQWCQQVGVALVDERLQAPAGTGARPLEAFEYSLGLIEEMCVAHGIDWRTSRVPPGVDWLRDAGTGQDLKQSNQKEGACAGCS